MPRESDQLPQRGAYRKRGASHRYAPYNQGGGGPSSYPNRYPNSREAMPQYPGYGYHQNDNSFNNVGGGGIRDDGYYHNRNAPAQSSTAQYTDDRAVQDPWRDHGSQDRRDQNTQGRPAWDESSIRGRPRVMAAYGTTQPIVGGSHYADAPRATHPQDHTQYRPPSRGRSRGRGNAQGVDRDEDVWRQPSPNPRGAAEYTDSLRVRSPDRTAPGQGRDDGYRGRPTDVDSPRTGRINRDRTRSRSPERRSDSRRYDRSRSLRARRSPERARDDSRPRNSLPLRSDSPLRPPISREIAEDTPAREPHSRQFDLASSPCHSCRERARNVPSSGITYIDHNDPDHPEYYSISSHFDIPPKFKGSLKDHFRSGDVIGQRHCEFAFDPRVTIGSPEFEPSSEGKICVKHNVPHIVKQVFDNHLECWSGRSSGRNALAFVPDDEKAMYMGLGNSGEPDTGNESPHPQLKVILLRGASSIDGTTHVLTGQVHKVVPTQGCYRWGRLETISRQQLLRVSTFCAHLHHPDNADISRIHPGLRLDTEALARLRDKQPKAEDDSLDYLQLPPNPVAPAAAAAATSQATDSQPAAQPSGDAAPHQYAVQPAQPPSQSTSHRNVQAGQHRTSNNQGAQFHVNHVNGGINIAAPVSPDRASHFEKGGSMSRRQTTAESDKANLVYD